MTRTERRRRQQRRRRAAMQRAACLALVFLAVAAAFAWSGRPQKQEATETAAPVTVTALPAEILTLEPITLEFEDQEAIDPMEASKVALAKMVWGEARGCRGNTCTSPETAYTTTSPRNGKAGRPGTGPWKASMRGS